MYIESRAQKHQDRLAPVINHTNKSFQKIDPSRAYQDHEGQHLDALLQKYLAAKNMKLVPDDSNLDAYISPLPALELAPSLIPLTGKLNPIKPTIPTRKSPPAPAKLNTTTSTMRTPPVLLVVNGEDDEEEFDLTQDSDSEQPAVVPPSNKKLRYSNVTPSTTPRTTSPAYLVDKLPLVVLSCNMALNRPVVRVLLPSLFSCFFPPICGKPI